MHIFGHTTKFDHLLQVLLCFGLHAILQREENELIPLIGVVHIKRQLVDELALRVLDICYGVKLLS